MPAWFVPAIIWGGRALYTGYRARRAMQAAQVATRVIQSQAPAAATAGGIVLGGQAIVNEMANGDEANAESLSTPIAGTRTCESCAYDCDAEWEEAYATCEEELSKPNPNRGITGGYTNLHDCARGLVSQRCGGNRVN